jgi:hypothetical protein
MKTLTPFEKMTFSYSIAKKWIEEQGNSLEEIDLNDKVQSSILKFVVIRDFPFLQEEEILTVMSGIKIIVDLAIGEQQLKLEQERKKNVYC